MRLVAVLLGGMCIVVLGCNAKTPVPPASGDVDLVVITRSGFDPSELTVAVGATVRWANMDGSRHWIVSEPGAPVRVSSPPVLSQGSYYFTFNVPGTYRYSCPYHGTDGGWRGTIVVQ